MDPKSYHWCPCKKGEGTKRLRYISRKYQVKTKAELVEMPPEPKKKPVDY